MVQAVAAAAPSFGAYPALPMRLKVLLIVPGSGAARWLTEAFAADSAAQIALEEAIGVTAGLARLRDAVFDALLVCHEPGAIDAIDLTAALRAGGHDEPLIILGHEPRSTLDALSYEAGADDYCCLADTTVRGLLWKFARAIQRFTLSRENRRLVQAERQRLQQERQEAQRLLEQQRALIADLESLSDGHCDPFSPSSRAEQVSQFNDFAAEPKVDQDAEVLPLRRMLSSALPPELVNHYRELLRAYVIMGAGNLAGEMAALAALLADSRVSAQQTMQLHVQVLEELVQGLGNRSARHVMNRADLLALEIMSHLADGYRQRYDERRRPARQRWLPGFDGAAA